MEGLFRLPAELRAQIWQYCLPEPRHILIPHNRKHRGAFDIPVALHICHESRAEAQRHYTLTPSTLELPENEGTDRLDLLENDLTWVDFSKDAICLEGLWNPWTPKPVVPSQTLSRAQRLAFEFSAPQNFMQLMDILTPVNKYIDSLPELREVVLYSMPKKWFEDHTGRVQERHPPLQNAAEAAKILLRLLHMLFGGHAWLDSGTGIPPPLRWQFISNPAANVWAGPFADSESYEYVFRCACTGRFEIQSLSWDQLGQLRRVQSAEPRVHHLVGCYEGCPEHTLSPDS